MRLRRESFSWAPVAAAILLIGVGLERVIQPRPADGASYHSRVKQAAAGFALHIGDWVGEDVPVPRTAVKLLNPNVIISRHYVNIANGQQCNVLLVQCGDAQDIYGHFPPNCYPSAGWTLTSGTGRKWKVNGTMIDGTEYRFAMNSFERSEAMVVDNFMVLPNGQMAPDMDAIYQAASDVRRRYFGAAQVQILTSDQMTADQREQVFSEFITALDGTLSAIRSGAVK